MSYQSYFSILIPVCFTLFGCTGGIDTKSEWKVYSDARARKDLSTSVGSLNRILSAEPNNASAHDSLAMLYAAAGMDGSAAITASQGLELHETDILMEILASSLKNIGDFEGSLNAYLRLMEMKPGDLTTPYEIAYAYINLNQFDQADKYIDLVIAHNRSTTTFMTEYVNNSRQEVPYKAVALNLRGFVQMQTGAFQQAANSYQEALNVFPEYQLAQNNLSYLIAQARSNNKE